MRVSLGMLHSDKTELTQKKNFDKIKETETGMQNTRRLSGACPSFSGKLGDANR